MIVFLDYWNFQIGWNQRAPKPDGHRSVSCDFLALPSEAVAMAEGAFGPDEAANRAPLQLIETRVYASHDPNNPKDILNRNWMEGLMGEREDFIVRNVPRLARAEPARCRSCGHEQLRCPACRSTYSKSSEKTVDAALIVDLLTLAWDDAFDIALLISSDHDFMPAIEALQLHGLRVVNGRWLDQGTRLADSCDSTIRLDTLVPILARGMR